jgi:hypothetical protein
MVAPGDPELAADLARRAASVSHDGEAIYGAQVVASMEAQAFVEPDLNVLLDTAVRFIPNDSVIYRMIGEIREWHAEFPDWRTTREQIAANYGYDKYPGNCHMVPNHALIILGLLYGGDDFQKALMITNTAGWDTDCNSGNVGCLLGIKNGLAGIDAGPDWRTPVSDRMYLPTVDGGRGITDAVRETYEIVNVGRALQGLEPLAPKQGSRFHFSLPGSVQGFVADVSPESRGILTLGNAVMGDGNRALALDYRHLAPGRAARAYTATFLPPDAIDMPGYTLLASPTLYSGQAVTAKVSAAGDNPVPVHCQLFTTIYGAEDRLENIYGPRIRLSAGQNHSFHWQIPETHSAPIARIGFELTSEQRADGRVYVDCLTWEGAPNTVLKRAEHGQLWRRAWVDHVQSITFRRHSAFVISHNGGKGAMGILSQGTRDWKDYRVSAAVYSSLMTSGGIAARVQGIHRFYALLLCADQKARLIRKLDAETILAEADFAWNWNQEYELALEVEGERLRGWISGRQLFDVRDQALGAGGVALVCEDGSIMSNSIHVQPISSGEQRPPTIR